MDLEQYFSLIMNAINAQRISELTPLKPSSENKLMYHHICYFKKFATESYFTYLSDYLSAFT